MVDPEPCEPEVPAEPRADAHELVVAFVVRIVRLLNLCPVHDARRAVRWPRRAFGSPLGSFLCGPSGCPDGGFPVPGSPVQSFRDHSQPSAPPLNVVEGAAASRFERSAVFPNPPDAATTTQKGLLRWCRR